MFFRHQLRAKARSMNCLMLRHQLRAKACSMNCLVLRHQLQAKACSMNCLMLRHQLQTKACSMGCLVLCHQLRIKARSMGFTACTLTCTSTTDHATGFSQWLMTKLHERRIYSAPNRRLGWQTSRELNPFPCPLSLTPLTSHVHEA